MTAITSKVQLAQIKLEALVENSQAHTLLPSERELCQSLKMSRETIRRAYERLILAGKCYRKASSGTYVSPIKKLRTILIVFPEAKMENKLATYFPPFLISFLQTFRQADPSVLPVICTHQQFLAEAKELKAIYVDISAILIFNMAFLFSENEALFRKLDLPILYVGNEQVHVPKYVSSLEFSEAEIIKLAITALKPKPNEKIYLLTPANRSVLFQRLSALKQVGQTHRINFQPLPSQLKNDFDDGILPLDNSHPILNWIAESKEPIRIFCTYDTLAIKLVNAAFKKKIKIPEQLRLVGVEGGPLSELAVIPVTQIFLSFSEMGTRSVSFILDLIGGGKTRKEFISAQLKTRKTTL